MHIFIKKLIKYTLGYPLYLISYLIPRNKKIWLFGNMHGYYDNSKYLFLHTLNDKKIQCYWISRDKESIKELNKKNIPSVYTFSLKGLYLSLRAKVYVYSYNIEDINFWTSARTKKINLWHGIGIKKIQSQISIGKSSNNFKKSLYNKIVAPQNFIEPDLFLSTSPLMNKHFADSFQIPQSKIIEANYPRCNILLRDKSEIIKFIKNNEPNPSLYTFIEDIKNFSSSYLYMPTWRDSGKKNLDNFELSKLNDFLVSNNKIFYIKLHPNELTNICFPSNNYSNIRIVDKRIDIYLLLPFIDCLITDYSSIYFDFLVMKNKKIILYAYDYKEYITLERDLAFSYDDYMPGVRAYNQAELLNEMSYNDVVLSEKLNNIKKIFWSSNNDNDYIIQSIKNIL
nr:CDP-glycerol glycerophosphotransferase family protein [Providencia stuartii]